MSDVEESCAIHVPLEINGIVIGEQAAMETFRFTTQVDDRGNLKLQLPSNLANHTVDIVLVVQPRPTVEQSWPADFFARIDAIEADDMIERPAQGC